MGPGWSAIAGEAHGCQGEALPCEDGMDIGGDHDGPGARVRRRGPVYRGGRGGEAEAGTSPSSAESLARATPPRGRLRALGFARGRPGHLLLGPPRANPSIIGGTDVAQGELGFLAFVAYFGQDSTTVCSGTVVAANVILTAAHCAVDEGTGATLDPSGFRVVTGSVDWTDDSARNVSGVSRVIVDPSYDPTNHNFDAALLVLSTPTAAPTIRLAGAADLGLESAGTDSEIAGWGETYAGSNLPDILQWAETVVQSPAYCEQFSPSYVPGFQLCTVDYPFDDAGTCNGDSGGPLLALDAAGKLVEIGITSYGPSDCNTYSGSYFTATASISGWAAGQINAANLSPPPSLPPSGTASVTAPATTKPSVPSRPKLPRMTLLTARTFTKQTLSGALGTPFKRGRSLQTSCHRASATRYSCGFTFGYRGNDYYGNVAVFYVYGARGAKVFWTDKYMVHWVNDVCYFHSGHRRSCTVHTKRGVW
ncbi:MAG: S1 family peptidase [Solirubrobacteraceae bacterium]